MAHDAGDFFFPTPESLLAAAQSLTPATPSLDVYSLLHQASGLPAPGLIEAIAARTKIDPEPLHEAKAFLRIRRSCLRSTPGEALALDMLDQEFGHGLLLRRLPDGSLAKFAATHWAALNKIELKAQLRRLAMPNPDRYGKSKSSVSEALTVITDLVPSGEALMLAKPKPVVNTLSGELWIEAEGEIELRPHRPESLLRHVLPVSFSPEVLCPRFDKMLEEMFANAGDPQALGDHLLELAGYALQPVRDLPTILLFWGAGQNGKSKLIEILSALVGSGQIWAGSLGHLSQDRFVLPDLAGKLLFIEDDAKDGVKIDDGLLKKISENKMVSTRRVRASHGITFHSMILPIIATNGTPHIEDTSKGLRRRLQVIPFDRQFKDQEADPAIAARIIAEELPGVLNRCLGGLQRLRARGHFAPPKDCQDALENFLAAANPFNAFLTERVVRQAGATTRINEIWNAFVAWCRGQGHRPPIAQRQLKARLQAAGYVVRKSSVMIVDEVALTPAEGG